MREPPVKSPFILGDSAIYHPVLVPNPFYRFCTIYKEILVFKAAFADLRLQVKECLKSSITLPNVTE